MLGQGFKIKWDLSEEYVPIDLSQPHDTSTTITTLDFQTDPETKESRYVPYIVSVTIDYISNKFLIRLKYDQAIQADEYAKENSLWGITEISFDPLNGYCSAKWIANDPYAEGATNRLRSVEFIRNTRLTSRERVLSSKLTRPLQSELRKQLLVLDETCVLTGETQDEALDAAHILPVANDGIEQFDNAILLRTDLHRLFDSGMFWFEVNSEGACVRLAENLTSGYYRNLLEGKKLKPKIFNRISHFLKLRMSLSLES